VDEQHQYLKPLNEGFFDRSLTTEASILQHLRFAFQTEKGTFLANPDYGCDADCLHQALSASAEGQLLSFLQESITRSDPRVARVAARPRGRTRDSLTIDLEVSYREITDSGTREKTLPLKAMVDLHKWNVEMEMNR